MAALVADRFSVVTTLSRSIAPIEANLTKYGLDRRCARVRACEVPVLALDDPTSGACERLSAEIERAQDGGGGRGDRARLRRHGRTRRFARAQTRLACHRRRRGAVKLAEALVGLGLATSKLGPYARPLPKTFAGMFEGLSSG